MTHAGAGTTFPLIILIVLALPILLLWIDRGSGNYQEKRAIGAIQLAILAMTANNRWMFA
jgi:hypothetical protein